MQEEGHNDDYIHEAMSSVCLSYDNMCHMDNRLVARDDLALPKPFNEAWKLISKVIDRLHLRNHVDKKCQKLYNLDEKLPKTFNTMACEQTFIWASRFKKVICASTSSSFYTGWSSIETNILRNVIKTVKLPFSLNWEKLPVVNFKSILYIYILCNTSAYNQIL